MTALAIEYTPRTKITLCGSLGKKFGKEHTFLLDRGDTREAMRAIDVNHPGFFRELANAKAKGLEFTVYRNGKNVGEEEFELGGCREIKIVPVICGSKRAGLLQTVLGIALVIVGAFSFGSTTPLGASLIAAGVASTAGGVIQMLSPQAKGLKTSAAPENQPGYAFGSARNTTASGNPVPLCIGYRRWGGAIISAGIYAEDQV
ncbi:tail assembly protein [Pseudomonas sp. NFIX28]|uniref:tail assembly protein n=1 Tax=Pseudomonas sp. NFIX28 TaxID=1566235 RepID=UPI0008979547|nr:tail assembly protein [Pseudomonas sp. NFIX28]SDZ15561.1 Phage-related protein, tail component [Pseudomonas sp. NFIX28]